MSDRENKRLLEQVQTDSLTGLGSRGRVQVDLPARFAEATVERPVSLVLLDLNGFKHFNDSFGHPAGDALLIRFGAALRDAVGSAGTAYRFGGDEFCLLLTCPPAQFDRVTQAAIRALSAAGAGYDINASWGSVGIQAESLDPDEALELADARMYDGLRRAAITVSAPGAPGATPAVAARRRPRPRPTRPSVQEVGACPIPISATRSTCPQAGSATGRPVRGLDVFVHGYLVDGRLWDGVVDQLSATHAASRRTGRSAPSRSR